MKGGRCEAFVRCLITEGFFGNTRLDDVVFSRIYRWPRAIHEGNGLPHMIIDEQATKGATRRAARDRKRPARRVDVGDLHCGRP